MKTLTFTIAFLFFAFFAQSEITIRGIITYQNTGAKMNAIQISAKGASPTIVRGSSNNDGEFVLNFPTGNDGDVVYLEISTPIYDLVNDKRELEIRLTDKINSPVRLVVCKKGERDANAVIYYNISTDYLDKNYKQKIKKRDDAIANLQTQITQKGANADALNKQIYDLQLEKAKLDEDLEVQKKNAWKLAEDFSRVDLAQADSIYRNAFETYKKGDIDGARQILNGTQAKQQEAELNKLNSDILKSETQVEKAEEKIKTAKQKIADAKIQRDSLTQAVVKKKMLDAQLAELQGKYNEAERLYKEAVHLDEKNVENLWTVAYFLDKQNQKDTAIDYYEKALALSNTESLKATFCNNLGAIYQSNNKPAEAEKFYLQSLNICERLAKNNPAQFEPDLARTVNNLGNYYGDNQKLAEAEKFCLQSLNISERLAKNNPSQFEPDLAITTMNLGSYYCKIHKIPEAEKFYLQSLSIYERLAKNNPAQFEPNLAITTMNLGTFYLTDQNMIEAEKFDLQSLNIFERLAKNNPAQFEPDVARTNRNLGSYYSTNRKMLEAESCYLRSLDIFERLAKSNPAQFEPDVARTAYNLGIFYNINQKMSEAEKFSLQALVIQEKLAQKYPSLFQPELAQTNGNIAWVYLFVKKFAESEKAARRGLAIDSTRNWLNNLCHALLFQYKDVEAKTEYNALKIQKDERGKSYRDILLGGIKDLRAAGLDAAQLDKAEKWVKEE